MKSQNKIPQKLQEILPKWAHFCLYIEQFITHELKIELKEKHIIVGVSGGVDSIALLVVLHYLSVRNNFSLSVAHLNHGLRDEAGSDASWVSNFCHDLGVQCFISEVDVSQLAAQKGIGHEEAGRIARYDWYSQLISEHNADFIALGHHLDDLCEDVLMRFIRGTGWPGLAGMDGYDPARSLIRPLLMLPKSTLRAFVQYLGINWCEDATNAQPIALRNRVRHEILPLIIRENPNFSDSVARLWKIGKIDHSYWSTVSETHARAILHKDLLQMHKAMRLRVYKSSLDALGKGQVLAETLFKLDNAWEDKKVGTVFQFPGDKTATITSDGIVFSSKD